MTEPAWVLVPDYFPSFQCKCGNCRTTCCGGWGISISMKEYFRLLGMECSASLRRRLDSALHVLENATEEQYAQLVPDWRGVCPLQGEDGFCTLQQECGEDILPLVCRYYPRGLRTAFDQTCSCANSCEAVLEQMFQQERPLTFLHIAEQAPLPRTQPPEAAPKAERDRDIQDCCIQILQDRTFSLPLRLIRLGAAIRSAEEAKHLGHPAILRAVRHTLRTDPADGQPAPALDRAFDMQRTLMAELAQNSRSLGVYTEAAFAAFGIQGAATEMEGTPPETLYQKAAARFESEFPKWHIYFEHMMVNHVFFDGYPYSARHESLVDEYVALCAVYAVLRFTVIGWMATHTGMDALVDVCAAAFRLIEHSSFTWNAPLVLQKAGVKTIRDVDSMVQA